MDSIPGTLSQEDLNVRGSLPLGQSLMGATVVGLTAILGLGTPAQADSLSFGIGSRHGHTSWSVGVGVGDGWYRRPYYRSYYYRPYYYPPPVVYYNDPPVVYTNPPVVYTTPPPVVYTAPNTATVVTSPAPVPATAPPAIYAPAQPAAPTTAPYIPQANDAWAMLSSNPSAAHELFTRQVQADSLDGMAKVGLSLSRAILGDTPGGVTWMRRAVSVDPAALQHVPIDQPLRDRVQKLMVSYNAQVANPAMRSDALFMLGALNTIVGDYNHAAAAVQDAAAGGDNQPTTVILNRMIQHELDTQPPAPPPAPAQAPAPAPAPAH